MANVALRIGVATLVAVLLGCSSADDSAQGRPGGAGGTGGSLGNFASCVEWTGEKSYEIPESFFTDVDPHCNEWESLKLRTEPPSNEVRIDFGDAYGGFSVSGCNIIYASRTGEVFLIDLSKKRRRPIAGMQGTPDSLRIDGPVVIFDSLDCGEDSCTSSLMVEDLATCRTAKVGTRPLNFADGGGKYRALEISNNRVTWWEYPPGGCESVGMLDLSTGEHGLVTEINSGICDASPDIHGDWLTWRRNQAGVVGSRILLKNLRTEQLIEVSPKGDVALYPATDGKYVIWSRGAGAIEDLFAYSLETGELITVVEAPGTQTGARIENGRVHWIDMLPSGGSAVRAKELPAGNQVTLRPDISPVIDARPFGTGLIWLDGRSKYFELRAVERLP